MRLEQLFHIKESLLVQVTTISRQYMIDRTFIPFTNKDIIFLSIRNTQSSILSKKFQSYQVMVKNNFRMHASFCVIQKILTTASLLSTLSLRYNTHHHHPSISLCHLKRIFFVRKERLKTIFIVQNVWQPLMKQTPFDSTLIPFIRPYHIWNSFSILKLILLLKSSLLE